MASCVAPGSRSTRPSRTKPPGKTPNAPSWNSSSGATHEMGWQDLTVCPAVPVLPLTTKGGDDVGGETGRALFRARGSPVCRQGRSSADRHPGHRGVCGDRVRREHIALYGRTKVGWLRSFLTE